MAGSVARILVVDDDEAAAETSTRLESSLDDVTATTATSIPEAMEVVENSRLECVVSDYEIPDGDGDLMQGGERFLRRVREYDESLPFVLFTEVGNEAIARKAVAEGVTDYIWRYDTPNAYDRLADRVRKAIRTRRTERRAEHFHQLNETMRLVHQAVIRASEPSAIDEGVVTQLTDGELYQHAAIGDVTQGKYHPRATARADTAPPFDWKALPVSSPPTELAVATQPDADEPLSIVTIPVVHDDQQFGLLALTTDRADAFEAAERGVLTDLGETIAHARTAVETRHRLEVHQRELQEQNDRLERFASAASHDLRNPLQVATGQLELLAEENDDNRIAKVQTALDRMEDLIEDVLLLARDRRLQIQPVPVTLETVVREAWHGIDTERGALRIDDGLGTIEADRTQLRRLLINLFRNSIEHGATEDGTHESVVTIWVERPDSAGGFVVNDDGRGFETENPEQLFELGFTTGTGNTGMGLAIVKEIAEAHGWTVSIGENDCGGARFEFRDVS